jgi:hypothetical protein
VVRGLRLSVVAAGFGLLLAVLPLPAFQFSTVSVGATEAVPPPRAMTSAERAAAQAAADEPLGSDRVVSEDVAAGDFTSIGFTFRREPSGPVLVRVKDSTGAYGPWHELGTEDAEGPDRDSPERGGSGTEPFWVRDAAGYQVSLTAADAAGASAVTVHDVERRSIVQADPVAGASIAPPFGLNLRSAWGARAPKSTSYGSTVKLAVVHHSASSNSYAPADVPAILRSIQAYHMDGRGWADIGYNFVVDKYGGVWEGRAGGIDRSVIGAHAEGFNTNSVGVMVIGDYTQTTPTAAALEGVAQVIGWKLYLFGNAPNGRVSFTSGGSPKYAAGVTVNLPVVVGHQDVGSTDCPGSIEAALGTIRTRAQDWFTWTAALDGTSPTGRLDDVSIRARNILHVSGWALDPNTSGPTAAIIFVDGVATTVSADWPRDDVAETYTGYDNRKGFLWEAVVGKGKHDVCVWAGNVGPGINSPLGCRSVVVK